MTVDGEQILPCLDVDARLGERRAQLGIPIEAAEDFREAIAAVLDFVVGAEQAARNRFDVGERVAAAEAVVADRKLARTSTHHAIEVLAHGEVGQERGVLRRACAFQSAPCMFGS